VPERYPFPKEAHIRKKPEYSHVFSRGRKVRGRHFLGYVLVEAGTETRLGLVVSRKVGQAVTRNRVKRLVREFFRIHRRRFPEGTQLVVIARPSSESLDGHACTAELEDMLGQWLRDA